VGAEPLLSVAKARSLLLDAVAPLGTIDVALGDALGRVLASDVAADRDFPPTDRSAMDGYALRAEDVTSNRTALRVVGEIPAGRAPGNLRVGPGEAVRLFTGAVVPEGADAVVMVEMTEAEADRRTVTVLEPPAIGQNIRRKGEDRRAGEPVLAAGEPIRAAGIAALAAVGATRVSVTRPPRVAVLSTGSEIVDAAETPASHQVRNSNARMLAAALAAMSAPVDDLGSVVDERTALALALARGLTFDVLIVSGGVSVGDYDLVAEGLRQAGCGVLFHTVAMRPGKPLLAARTPTCLVLGLPGNPVSAFTAFHVFAAPALRRLMGYRQPVRPHLRATLVDPLRVRPGRASYSLARLAWRDGRALATPVRSASSGDVLSLSRANAFVVVPADAAPFQAGDEVEVMPWSESALDGA
jgi:molybdopterin molybdotransferase